LAATVETIVTPGKRVMVVIAAISVTVGTPLVVIAETIIILGTRLN